MSNFDRMKEILEKQKQQHINDGPLPVSVRKDWINRCISSLIKYQNEIADAISEDFGHRSKEERMEDHCNRECGSQ